MLGTANFPTIKDKPSTCQGAQFKRASSAVNCSRGVVASYMRPALERMLNGQSKAASRVGPSLTAGARISLPAVSPLQPAQWTLPALVLCPETHDLDGTSVFRLLSQQKQAHLLTRETGDTCRVERPPASWPLLLN